VLVNFFWTHAPLFAASYRHRDFARRIRKMNLQGVRQMPELKFIN